MRKGSGSGWAGAVVLAAAAAVAALAPAARADGCKACGQDMFCASVVRGASLCIGSGDACLMGGRCGHPGPGPVWGDAFAMIQLSVLEAPGGPAFEGGARVLRGAGPLAVGREAGRLAREASGGAGADPEIVFSGVGEGEGVTVAFRSRLGDGFTLRRDADGRGARVTIRAVNAGRPGRLLARERLEERDVLAVRVRLDGRPRVVLVAAPTLERSEGQGLEREARLALRGANGARLGASEVPFEMVPVDD